MEVFLFMLLIVLKVDAPMHRPKKKLKMMTSSGNGQDQTV